MEKKLRDFFASSGGEKAGDFVVQYGQEILFAAVFFLAGMIAVKVFISWLRKTLLSRFNKNQYLVSTMINVLHILLIFSVVFFVLHYLGMKDIVIARLFFAIVLVTIGVVVFFRRYLPTLPFKVGNRIEVGGLRGRVEAINISHTHLITRSGKNLFIPNKLLANSMINNFHFSPTRRVQVKVSISYQDDLLKAKIVLMEIMDSDSRIIENPAPAVYVKELSDFGVILAAWCWVENSNYLNVRSDLTERVKLRFDEEGISIPFPQLDVHVDAEAENLKSDLS